MSVFSTFDRWLGVRLEFLGNLTVFFAALFAVVQHGIEGAIVGLAISYALQVLDSQSV